METAGSAAKKQPVVFGQSVLIPLAAWLVDIGLADVLWSVLIYDSHSGPFHIFTSLSWFFAVLLGLVWLPVGIIGARRASKKGWRAVLVLVLVTFVVAPLVFTCALGLLIALSGGF